MGVIQSIIGYTIREHLRNRIFLNVLMFGLILIGGGVVISTLAVDEQVRMMMNLGIAGTEFLSTLALVFLTVNLILSEMESRSIYLMLSHPVERWQYIVGRFAGTFLAMAVGVLMMSAMHFAAMMLFDWEIQSLFFINLLCTLGKMAVVGSLALMLSVATSSTASAMAFTIFLWVMGHFSSELVFIAEKSSSSIVQGLVFLAQKIAPNFSYFNLRDFWAAPQLPEPMWYAWLLLYTVSYVGVMLFLTTWFFEDREF